MRAPGRECGSSTLPGEGGQLPIFPFSVAGAESSPAPGPLGKSRNDSTYGVLRRPSGPRLPAAGIELRYRPFYHSPGSWGRLDGRSFLESGGKVRASTAGSGHASCSTPCRGGGRKPCGTGDRNPSSNHPSLSRVSAPAERLRSASASRETPCKPAELRRFHASAARCPSRPPGGGPAARHHGATRRRRRAASRVAVVTTGGSGGEGPPGPPPLRCRRTEPLGAGRSRTPSRGAQPRTTPPPAALADGSSRPRGVAGGGTPPSPIPGRRCRGGSPSGGRPLPPSSCLPRGGERAGRTRDKSAG